MEETKGQTQEQAKEQEKEQGGAREWIVNGFLFADEEHAQEAEKELQKIRYLEAKINYSDIRKVRAIYEKAVAENVFRSCVGLFYLKGMRDFLVREDEKLEDVLPRVPSPVGGLKIESRAAEARRREKQERLLAQKSAQFRVSVIVNVLLVVAVAAMFVIALNSEQPNILNYEKALTDRYAVWAQELTEREQAVRQRELEILRGEQGISN